jgi:7-cyano-7-deazaguanine synthase
LQSYVPARNLLMLAHGVACAEAKGAGEVWFGPNADDHAFYPDCRPAFVAAMSAVATLGTKQSVEIIAPHVLRSKCEVVARGIELGAPLHLTTSCADHSGRCGVCRGCVARRAAFAELGAVDPTSYLA